VILIEKSIRINQALIKSALKSAWLSCILAENASHFHAFIFQSNPEKNSADRDLKK
jgi:hypothetical protein